MNIGIDFGTCFSSVAFMQGSRPVTNYLADLESGRSGIPTLFSYSAELRKDCFGRECLGYAASVNGGKDVIKYMKRLVRENAGNINKTVTSGGKTFTIKEVVEKYIEYLIRQAHMNAEESGDFEPGEKIEKVVITAPVGISEGQDAATNYNRLLSETVKKITGLPDKSIIVIREPVAAAISYLHGQNIRQKYVDKQSVMVFDLGGGTLDVTIVEYDPTTNTYTPVVKEGDLNIGGNNWDAELANLLLKKAGLKSNMFTGSQEFDFYEEVNKAKHALSEREDYYVAYKCQADLYSAMVTRSEFESATKHLMDGAINVAKRAIDSYSSIGSVDKIVIVGGGSNMPQVRKALRTSFRQFNDDAIIQHDPSKAICKGAAIYTRLSVKATDFINATGLSFATIQETASCTYGFDCRNSDEDKSMVYNLIFKKCNIPVTVKSKTTFTPIRDDQTTVTFRIYESQVDKKDCLDGCWMDFGSGEKLNQLKVEFPVPEEYYGRAKEFSCRISLSLDKNEVLDVSISDGKGNSISCKKIKT